MSCPSEQGSLSKRRERRGEKLVSGWQVNAIATLLSGFPFTPQVGSNRSGDGDTRNPDRPSLNPAFTGPVITGNPNQWFNPDAFILPTAGTYGNLGRGVFNGPVSPKSIFRCLRPPRSPRKPACNFAPSASMWRTIQTSARPTPLWFSGTAYSATAGLITTTATTSRQIQLGLKLIF